MTLDGPLTFDIGVPPPPPPLKDSHSRAKEDMQLCIISMKCGHSLS